MQIVEIDLPEEVVEALKSEASNRDISVEEHIADILTKYTFSEDDTNPEPMATLRSICDRMKSKGLHIEDLIVFIYAFESTLNKFGNSSALESADIIREACDPA